jgi:cation transport ATPase
VWVCACFCGAGSWRWLSGTITDGHLKLAGLGVVPGAAPVVIDMLQNSVSDSDTGDGQTLLLKLAAAVEASTRHPLAAALSAEAAARGLSLPHAADAVTEPGSGELLGGSGGRV